MPSSAAMTQGLRKGALPAPPSFPRTRYLGSKRKLASAIVRALRGLKFHTVLDAFGGTGAVAYALKAEGKSVTYNDILAFNHQIGLALIENDDHRLDGETISSIGERRPGRRYEPLIAETFRGIYFTDEENEWLDVAVGNIRAIVDRYHRAIAWFALFQAALAKRPYNLFHRRNLYMRTADVRRGFGNKATWDRSFNEHFRAYAQEANRAVIHSKAACRAACADALVLAPEYDLVYIDPPYVSARGVGVDYRDWYHFLEGLMRYDEWVDLIDRDSRHRRLLRRVDPWSNPLTCREAFGAVVSHFRRSSLVVSYRSDGIPTLDELTALLRDTKRHVEAIELSRYQYALSTNRKSCESLLIGTDREVHGDLRNRP